MPTLLNEILLDPAIRAAIADIARSVTPTPPTPPTPVVSYSATRTLALAF